MRTFVHLCGGLFSLVPLCIRANVCISIIAASMYPCLHLFVKYERSNLFHFVSDPERMLHSKGERRKCGPWLHGWLGVLFTQCVLHGLMLVKVLSTRPVSISSTLSLIPQPNPSMSDNMCGSTVHFLPDGISHQCVIEA